MKHLRQHRGETYVAPEIDDRPHNIGPLSTVLDGPRLILPLEGSPYVALFDDAGWIKLYDVKPDEVQRLIAKN